MEYDEHGLFYISDSALWLPIPLQLQKTTHHHKIMCGCKICIQDETYQESLKNRRKQRLKFLKRCAKSFMSGSDEKLN